MNVSKTALGIGAGIAAAIGVGVTVSNKADRIMKQHPTGSDADGALQRAVYIPALIGTGSTIAGMVAVATGRQALGATLIGGGIGGLVGSMISGWQVQSKHGIGSDTIVQRAINEYDANRNGQIEMLDRGWFKPAETTRSHTYTTEDSDGHTHWHTDYYSIDRLATRADRDANWIATRSELSTAVAAYDVDGNGRLQGDELKRFDREVGERRVW